MTRERSTRGSMTSCLRDEARAVEEHVAACRPCADAVAEARGLIAASSRILMSLDSVPRDVVPLPSTPRSDAERGAETPAAPVVAPRSSSQATAARAAAVVPRSVARGCRCCGHGGRNIRVDASERARHARSERNRGVVPGVRPDRRFGGAVVCRCVRRPCGSALGGAFAGRAGAAVVRCRGGCGWPAAGRIRSRRHTHASGRGSPGIERESRRREARECSSSATRGVGAGRTAASVGEDIGGRPREGRIRRAGRAAPTIAREARQRCEG